jgi:isoquinoline 1-oxidoreductase subunit beta
MAEMPPVDVVILEGDDKAIGVGEEGVGLLAPAVTNALFAATGKRITTLPLPKSGFRFA